MAKNNNIEIFENIRNFNIFSSNKHLHDFNFISATIGNLLPYLDFENHINIAKSSAFYQILSNKDETDYDFLKSLQKPTIDFNNKILVTFHYSSYRLFCASLISWNVPFKLIADKNYILTQGKRTFDAYNKITNELNVKKFDFEIFDAEDRTVLFKCMDAIKKGFALVFYADGNSGVGGMTKDKDNMVKIPFLNSHIYARSGIVVLASILKRSITTVIFEREKFENEVSYFINDNIPFCCNRKNSEDIKFCTEIIFKNLEDRLKLNSGAWEGWYYYHNFIDFEDNSIFNQSNNFIHKSKTVFNHRYYGIGILSNCIYYIINKRTLRLIPISKLLYDNLFKIISTNKISEIFPVYKSLYKEGILC